MTATPTPPSGLATSPAPSHLVTASLVANRYTLTPLASFTGGALAYATVSGMEDGVEASRGVGAIWEAEGFRFEEAAAAATDQHLTTAGGVKLYALRQGSVYNAKQWGCVVGENNGARISNMHTFIGATATAAAPVVVVFDENYGTSAQWLVDSNVTFHGPGGLVRMAPMADTVILMTTRVQSAGLNLFAQRNVTLANGFTLDGADMVLAEVPTTQHLSRFDSVDKLKIDGCKFRNHRRGLIVITGCRSWSVTDNDFENWGFIASDGFTGDGGAAIGAFRNFAIDPVDETASTEFQVSNNRMRNGRWNGIAVFGENGITDGNTITNTKECGIFVRSDAGGGAASRLIVTNNVVVGVRRLYVDAVGIVGSIARGKVTNNYVEDTDLGGINFGEGAQDVLIADNVVVNACRESAYFWEGAAQISIRDLNVGGSPGRLKIINNTVRDTADPPIAPAGIRIAHVSGTAQGIVGLEVSGNTVRGAAALEANNLVIDADIMSASVGAIVRDNPGAAKGVKTQGNLGGTAVAVSHTGNTVETVLGTVTIPGGMMKPNSRLDISTLFTVTNSANNKTLRVRLGGIGGTVFAEYVVTTVATVRAAAEISNRNSRTSQVGGPTTGSLTFTGWGSSAVAVVTGTVNTAADTTLVITGQLATAGETITLQSFDVELVDRET